MVILEENLVCMQAKVYVYVASAYNFIQGLVLICCTLVNPIAQSWRSALFRMFSQFVGVPCILCDSWKLITLYLHGIAIHMNWLNVISYNTSHVTSPLPLLWGRPGEWHKSRVSYSLVYTSQWSLRTVFCVKIPAGAICVLCLSHNSVA